MALTDDQKAMLRLLAQREEGYEDMAALMGISVEEVRARVKEALAEVDQPEAVFEEPVESAPEPTPPPPTPEPEPAQPTPAEPATTTPTAPAAAEPKAAAAEAPAQSAGRGKRSAPLPSLKMPKDRGALIGLGAGALVLLIFAVVLIVSGDGGGSSSTTTSAESGQGDTTLTAAESKNLTQAVLSPTNGGDASGRALFGRYQKSVLLQVEADGLAPSGKGESYTIWLYSTPKVALQIGAVPVDDSGKISAQVKIPTQLLAYVAGGSFSEIDISLTSDAAYKAAFAKAKSERKLPPYVGESVLRGKITGPAIKQQ